MLGEPRGRNYLLEAGAMKDTQPLFVVVVFVVGHMLPWRERKINLLNSLFLICFNHPTILPLANPTRSHLISSLGHSLNGRATTPKVWQRTKQGKGEEGNYGQMDQRLALTCQIRKWWTPFQQRWTEENVERLMEGMLNYQRKALTKLPKEDATSHPCNPWFLTPN